MKTKLFYKIFAFTFGMMLLITVLAHVLIFMIAPSENVLITSTTVTNEDVLAFSEVDMPQLITQTILKSFPLSFACCMVISLVFSFLFSKGKTPVTELNATLENMILKIGEYSDYESYLPRCKEITEQLAEMIKDILNASRLQMQMEDVPVTTFSLAECVSELCEPYRLIAETNGLRFQIEIIEDMSVRLPENQLKKALSNILSNAVNYTEAERHIKVKLEKSVLSIQNECVPLSPDELQHIFEPFYRPNRARDPANGGNGLGLYIVKTILDKQGLQYCFTSMKSKTGMEFVIYF